MGWEEYHSEISKNSVRPRVTITRHPRIHLNRAAHDLLGSPELLLLLYDEERRAIGLRPVTDAKQYGFRVKRKRSGPPSRAPSSHGRGHRRGKTTA
jgi:hypothetical protein